MFQNQVFNFSAGPAILPREVLMKVQEELLDYQGTGMSVMTISHRSEWFLNILHEAEKDLSELLNITDDYAVLFLQGGASQQFIATVLNLSLNRQKKIGCVVSGNWSRIAYQQMNRLPDIEVQLLATSEIDGHFLDIPKQNEWRIDNPLDFIHFTSNETVHGIQFQELPHPLSQDYPVLVSDMSSDLLSRPINVSDFGLIYAGAQKNIGPAGVTIVIVKKELLEQSTSQIPVPDVLNYQSHLKKNGMYNTPNTFGVYVCGLVMKWLLSKGGLSAMESVNIAKAQKIYECIDGSGGFYQNHIQHRARSNMNIVFFSPNQELDALFVKESTEANLLLLKGYRSLGGMRASIYNAMPMEGIVALCEFMQDFQHRYG